MSNLLTAASDVQGGHAPLMCEHGLCCNRAEHEATSPFNGRTVHLCVEHARAVISAALAMGFPPGLYKIRPPVASDSGHMTSAAFDEDAPIPYRPVTVPPPAEAPAAEDVPVHERRFRTVGEQETWDLANFCEGNAEDLSLDVWLEELRALGVGERVTLVWDPIERVS